MYRAPEIFDVIRNPFTFSDEGKTRSREEKETEDEARRLNVNFVPLERINNHRDYFGRVIEIRPSFKAVFGKNKAEPLNEVLRIRGQIVTAVQMLAELDDLRTEEDRARYSEDRKKYRAIIWNHGGNDEITTKLERAIADMEAVTEPVLRSQLRK